MKTYDVHGLNKTQVEVVVPSYIKECFKTNEYHFLIIHGYGKQVLSETVKNILAKSIYVKSYEMAPPNIGGAGATLVYLKGKNDV